MQFYLVAGLVRDVMVFHPLLHAHDALPKAGIYAILAGGWGIGAGPRNCGTGADQLKLPDGYNSFHSERGRVG